MLTVTLPVLLRDPAGMARTATEYVQHFPPPNVMPGFRTRDLWL